MPQGGWGSLSVEKPPLGEILVDHRITVSGCDDSTIVDMLLRQDEVALIERVAKAVTEASAYDCMPTMGIQCLHPELLRK